MFSRVPEVYESSQRSSVCGTCSRVSFEFIKKNLKVFALVCQSPCQHTEIMALILKKIWVYELVFTYGYIPTWLRIQRFHFLKKCQCYPAPVLSFPPFLFWNSVALEWMCLVGRVLPVDYKSDGWMGLPLYHQPSAMVGSIRYYYFLHMIEFGAGDYQG